MHATRMMTHSVAGRAVAVVDDDDSMREAIRRVLELEGLVVEVFGTAEEFLAREAASRAECLVFDIRLPGMSGLDLYEHLLVIGSAKPAIFITANDDPSSRRRATQQSNQYLVKPFHGEDLINAVARSISRA